MRIQNPFLSSVAFDLYPDDIQANDAVTIYFGGEENSTTDILFMPSSRRRGIVIQNQTETFDSLEDWIRRARLCVDELQKRITPLYIHCVARGRDCQKALSWAVFNPLTFSSLTLIDPPETKDLKRMIKEYFDILPPPVPLSLFLTHSRSHQHKIINLLRPDFFGEWDGAGILSEKMSQWIEDFQKKFESPVNTQFNIKTVLVTGATGLLGSRIVRDLLAEGYFVKALGRDRDKAKAMETEESERLVFVLGDLRDPASLAPALNNVDAVIHCAAFVDDWGQPEDFYAINVKGTEHLLHLAEKNCIQHFVFISSLSVYGDQDQYSVDENMRYRSSRDPYNNTKVISEIMVRKFCLQKKIPFTIIRPGVLYGERDRLIVPRMIKKLCEGNFFFVGNGESSFRTAYTGNVSLLAVRSLGHSKSINEVFHITDDPQPSIRRFVTDIADALGYRHPKKSISCKTAWRIVSILETVYKALGIKSSPPFTKKQVIILSADRIIRSPKAYRLLGEIPYSYNQGIRITMEFFKARQNHVETD
jgi:nucleoside-diphosphate-sugar epimerase